MFSPEEVHFLIAHEQELLELYHAGNYDFSAKNTIATITALKGQYGHYARAVAELSYARFHAKNKIPEHFLMCADSAQQATAWPVALFRAEKIAALGYTKVHDLTCSIGTELLALQGTLTENNIEALLIGSDIDFSRLLMAQHNGVAHAIHADALTSITTDVDLFIADPARRSGGNRIFSPEDLIPPLPSLIRTYSNQAMSIKCAPGIDYSSWKGLVSVVSLNGGVKETCLYTHHFSDAQDVQVREAIILRTRDEHPHGYYVHDRIDSTQDYVEQKDIQPHSSYIVEPDGAVIRAGLVAHWAYREKLYFLDPHIAFLTGDHIPAGHSGWEVYECLSLKKLKSAVASYQFSSLEILIRGVDINPDILRKKLLSKNKKIKNNTQQAGTIIIARIGEHPQAFICGPREYA